MKLSLRAGVLLAAGSLGVHELRYLAGYGDAAETATAGHGYLAWLAPLVALSVAVGCGAWLARIGRRSGTGPALTWTCASASLAAVYAAQETIEALTSPGHPGMLGHGGWIAVPIIVAVGGVVALLVRGVHAADRAAAAAARPWSPHRASAAVPLAVALPAAAPLSPRPRAIARRLAGRAPPLAS